MIKVVIIDDEPLAASLVSEYLAGYPEFKIMQICQNGLDGIKAIREHNPDLLFLDVQMPKISGFEMLELLDEPVPVIFTTAFEEFAIKAFEKNAVDYLLKPISPERFAAAIGKFKGGNSKVLSQQVVQDLSVPGQLTRVVVKDGSVIRIIPVSEILMFEAYDDYVKVITRSDCFLKKITMQKLEDSLDAKQFVRVHRSFIVQVNSITRLELTAKESYSAVLINGVTVPLSRSGYSKLKDILSI